MSEKRKEQICALLKSIETGEEEPTRVVNPDKYIQHNPQTQEGGEGLATLFKRLSKSDPRVNIVRIFSDGDFVFGHTEYDFSSRRIGFEIFRFEGDQTVEHWDNIQARLGPNSSGHSMVDGATEVTDLNKTETNRQIVRSFTENILINRRFDDLDSFMDEGSYIEHHPDLSDDLEALKAQASSVQYDKIHRILAEGNFVLCVCEGTRDTASSSLFDLYRIENGKIVEHWNTTEKIPAQSEWKNENGKF